MPEPDSGIRAETGERSWTSSAAPAVRAPAFDKRPPPNTEPTVAVVGQRIDEHPDGFRIVLMRGDIEELDTRATAMALGVSPGVVRKRLHRATQALPMLLERKLA